MNIGKAARFVWDHKQVSLLVLAAVAALGYVARLHAQLDAAEEARVSAELALDSAEAAADTTREVLVDAFSENVRYFQRRVVQVRELTADSVERALGEQPVARGDVEALLDELVVSDTADGVRVRNEIQYASFEGYQAPYTFEAAVAVPPPSDPRDPVLQLRVGLERARITYRITCAPAPSGRVFRPAHVTFGTPDWLTLRVESARQSAEVCNQPAPEGDGFPWGLYAGGTAGGATAGFLLADDPSAGDAALGAGLGLATSFATDQLLSLAGFR